MYGACYIGGVGSVYVGVDLYRCGPMYGACYIGGVGRVCVGVVLYRCGPMYGACYIDVVLCRGVFV